MLLCRVCHKELTNPAQPCPRCKFKEFSVMGNDTAAQKMLNQMADTARVKFLSDFDFGVTVYYWKDKDGQIALDRSEYLSFGSGSDLVDKTCWLDQLFARIPDVKNMELELSIRMGNRNYRRMTVSVPVPGGNYLQQVGISLSRDMTVKLLLKNTQEQTQSASVSFLLD